MSQENNSNTGVCLSCQSPLQWVRKLNKQQSLYQCESCQIDYKKIVFCPDCQDRVETIQACGSSSYFCPSCNSLKSKAQCSAQFIKSE